MVEVEGVGEAGLDGCHIEAAPEGNYKEEGEQLGPLPDDRELVDAAQPPVVDVEQLVQLPEVAPGLQGSADECLPSKTGPDKLLGLSPFQAGRAPDSCECRDRMPQNASRLALLFVGQSCRAPWACTCISTPARCKHCKVRVRFGMDHNVKLGCAVSDWMPSVEH